MKFEKEERECISAECFPNVDSKLYNGLRLAEHQKENIDWLNTYVEYLMILMKDDGGIEK